MIKSQNCSAKRIKVDVENELRWHDQNVASHFLSEDSGAEDVTLLMAAPSPHPNALCAAAAFKKDIFGEATASHCCIPTEKKPHEIPMRIPQTLDSTGKGAATSCSHSFVIGNKTFCMEVRGLTEDEKPESLDELLVCKGPLWRPEETFEMVLRDKVQIKHMQELQQLEEALHKDMALCKPLIKHLKKINKDCMRAFCVPRVAASFLQMVLGCRNLWKGSLFMQFMATSLAQEAEHFCKLKATQFSGGAGVKSLHYYSEALLQLSHTKPCIFQLEDLAIVRVIGRGCTGKVFLVKEKTTGSLYALKSIHKSWVIRQDEIEHTKAERDILALIASLSHPFLVRLVKSFQTTTDLFLLFEYHPGGDLATHLTKQRKFSAARCKFYAAEILVGIDRLHRSGIIYRDLKPENVLISRAGHVVLTDFGLSKHFEGSGQTAMPADAPMKTQTFCGTAEYLAPEILLGQAYGMEVDWWSFGPFLYEMLVGSTPFWAETTGAMYKRVMSDPLEFPATGVEPAAKELLVGLLQRNPARRWTAAQIKASSYFGGIDWSAVEGCRLLPPYVPHLASCDDLSHFDVSFLELPTNLTPTVEVIGSLAQNAFLGFSFESSM